MKKNKSLFIILIFLAIFIVQPNNFNAIKSGLTQNDIPNQLNIADSAEEKNPTQI
ncbi:conserved domain protein [Streptococcus infantis SK970]|nr:conserved domain protein [Streptococcus infantis SK970]